MAENSKISWTDHTFNPWIGCQKVAPECDHCYAEALNKRWGHENWGPHAERRRTSEANWKKPLKWNRDAMETYGRPARVFCGSMCDWADNQVPPEWRADLWEMVRQTPNLFWQFLTKRPQNIAKMLPEDWGDGYENVILMTTAGSQPTLLKNMRHLESVRARYHGLSAEPLISPMNLWEIALPSLDWCIVGGESGPGHRPMDPDWARSIRDQCAEAGVPFFYKQDGGPKPGGEALLDGRAHKEFPDG